VDTTEQTITALGTKRADFVVDDMSVLSQVLKERPGQFEIVGEIGKTDFIAWGTRKSDPKLTEYLNGAIKKAKASGQMNALQEKYLGVTFELPERNFIPGATQ
jgi:polar amino acid transport system substrate-binding protein